MSRVTIDRIIKCTPCTNPKTRKTVFEIQCEGTVDGQNVGSITCKTWMRQNADGLSEGMTYDCEPSEYPKGSGNLSYLLPKILPAPSGGQPAGQAAQAVGQVPPVDWLANVRVKYTDGDLAALLAKAHGVAYAIENDPTLATQICIAYFNAAVRLGIKAGGLAEQPVGSDEPDAEVEYEEVPE